MILTLDMSKLSQGCKERVVRSICETLSYDVHRFEEHLAKPVFVQNPDSFVLQRVRGWQRAMSELLAFVEAEEKKEFGCEE